MHSGEHDDVRAGFCSLLRETQRIADKICDILDFGNLIVMSEDNRVQFLLQGQDFTRKSVEASGWHRLSGSEPVWLRCCCLDGIHSRGNLTSAWLLPSTCLDSMNR